MVLAYHEDELGGARVRPSVSKIYPASGIRLRHRIVFDLSVQPLRVHGLVARYTELHNASTRKMATSRISWYDTKECRMVVEAIPNCSVETVGTQGVPSSL